MNDARKTELLKIIRIAAKDEAFLDLFLEDLLTPAEYRELATRWQIIKKLAKGERQREIAKSLKIGISTVTRGSRTLEDQDGGFNQLLKRLK